MSDDTIAKEGNTMTTINALPQTMVWASSRAIRERIADVPENWLIGFVVRHPASVRKFAHARNGKLLYRVADVLDAIENREGGIA